MKNKKTIFILGLIILTILYLILRLYKFEQKTTYHLDQGLHLLETYQMVEDKKIRLIGPMVSSKTFMDRGFFIGPQYYYVLAILGILTKWNPISIDIILLLIELGFILYFTSWIKKKYGIVEALMVFSTLTFSRYFIIHSRFFWNPHFLLPLGILGIIFLDKYIQKNKIRYLACFGVLWGLAFGFHYSAVFWGIPLLVALFLNKKLFKWQTLIVPLSFILGDLPWFVFEIKHNFYNIRTMWMVMIQSSTGGKMEPHYFVYPLGFFILFGIAWILKRIKKNKIFIAVIWVLAISLLQIWMFDNQIPYGHPKGWNYLIQKEIVKKILENGCPKDFNVASTISSDTRFHDLRFLLIANGCKPMGVEEYPKAEKLFLVAPIDRPPETETVWEVSSLDKFKINQKINISPIIILYELEKIKK